MLSPTLPFQSEDIQAEKYGNNTEVVVEVSDINNPTGN